MLAKAVCLVAALVSSSLCFNPPPSSKSVDPKKEQRVVSEVRFLTEYANKFPFVFISIAVLETALYLVLMTNNGTSGGGSGAASGILKGSSSLPLHDQVIFQEMAVLKTWQMIATVLCLLGYALRKWSFITLDRFFTVRNSVFSGLFLFMLQGFLFNLFLQPSFLTVKFPLCPLFSLHNYST